LGTALLRMDGPALLLLHGSRLRGARRPIAPRRAAARLNELRGGGGVWVVVG
jgi:hypothetical protein